MSWQFTVNSYVNLNTFIHIKYGSQHFPSTTSYGDRDEFSPLRAKDSVPILIVSSRERNSSSGPIRTSSLSNADAFQRLSAWSASNLPPWPHRALEAVIRARSSSMMTCAGMALPLERVPCLTYTPMKTDVSILNPTHSNVLVLLGKCREGYICSPLCLPVG